MTELPKSWVRAPLGEVAEVRLGRQRSPKNHTGDNMRPYLRAANVTWDGLEASDVKEMHFSPSEVDIYRLEPGDVLVVEASGSKSEVGKPAVWRGEMEDCCFQNTLLRVRSRALRPEYLRYLLLLEARSGRLGRAARGVGIHHLGAGGLSSYHVALAPLPEQERIVAAIEEHFSRLDNAEATLRNALNRAAGLRVRVLSEAVAGDWPVAPLGELLLRLRNGVFVSRPASAPPGIPIFRISAVRPLSLDISDVRYASLDDGVLENYGVQPGDLLFTRYSGNPDFAGACAVVPELTNATLHPDKLIRGVVDRRVAEPDWLCIAANVGNGRRQIESRLTTTAGQVGIAGSALRTVGVPLPPLDEQRRIVAEIERQLSILDSLGSAVDRALKRSTQLRRAILERAFTGRLVPQDPSDEPASVLLETVAAERAAKPPARRGRRRARMEAT